MKPTATISDIDPEAQFLVGSDPTINTDDTSDDMEIKGYTNNFGEYLW